MTISDNIKKILVLSMESSYRKKEIYHLMNRILNKIEKNYLSQPDELEKIKKEFHELVQEINQSEKKNKITM